MPSRNEFDASVRKRDEGRCVVCGHPGTAVHHIIDRSLWPDGGYHIDNGVLLCDECHLDAETTVISCSELRSKAGICNSILPPFFDHENEYDHWGNVVEPTGVRYPGPIFFKENVQKALKAGKALDLFTWEIKYPRTYHFSYSPNVQSDDRMHKDDHLFDGKEVVVSEKMDGECTTMMSNKIYARSVNSGPHQSRNWVHALHGRIAHEIPDKWRICGENLYAEHSIHYDNLPSYFLVYSIWDETNCCLSWDDTVQYAGILGLHTVPVFYKGLWDKNGSERAFEAYCHGANKHSVEGYVVRLSSSFRYESFCQSTAKWVRAGHVITDDRWLSRPVVPNGLGSTV